jgi:aminoglycoside phosphotransferase (APT) family kinase protein
MPELEAQRERLAEWLKRQPTFGPQAEIDSFAPLAGGQSSVLFRLTVQDRPEAFVIRMEPRGRQIFLTPDIVREFRIAEGLAQAGIPTAPLIAVEPKENVLGAPFMVMGEVNGVAPLGRPSMHTSGLLTELDAGERTRLSENSIEVLAKIHAVNWRRHHPFLAAGDSSITGLDRHLDHLTKWYAWTVRDRNFPLTDTALAYLQSARAGLTPQPDVLLWGDARPGNILFAPDQSVAAVLDLEAALIGPSGLDLGYWLMMDCFHAEAIGVARLPGWPREAETIALYAESAGIPVPDLDYFIVMGAFFMATTIIRAADLGIASGKFASGTRFAFENTATQIIADRLGLQIPPLSPDFVAHRGLPSGTAGLAG